MQPTFTKALYYHVRFTCITPLRSGNLEQDENELLRRSNGTLLLSAGSIVGAFRHWKNNTYLFGTTTNQSALVFSDAVIKSSRNIFRHRICLRQKILGNYVDTGSGINGSNAEIAVLPRGTEGEFTIVWRGTRPFQEVIPLIELYLSAVDCGQIQLGAERSNDFGRVKLSVSRGCYDMLVPEQREAWISGQWTGESISLPVIPEGNVLLDVAVDMPKIIIRNAFNRQHYAEDGKPIVPSSSIKGVLRRWCGQLCPLFGDSLLENNLFGSLKTAGNLIVSDGFYVHTHKKSNLQRTQTDRISGSLLRKPAQEWESIGGQLQFQLRIDASQPKAVGLLLYILRDFGLGMFELGASSAIGCGYARSIHVTLTDPKGVSTLSVANGIVTIDDPHGIIAHYVKKLGGRKNDT
jgi:CRISPR/Cas system CSM-associated protein Csm3 (group 7 of RAMP superfamily)